MFLADMFSASACTFSAMSHGHCSLMSLLATFLAISPSLGLAYISHEVLRFLSGTELPPRCPKLVNGSLLKLYGFLHFVNEKIAILTCCSGTE